MARLVLRVRRGGRLLGSWTLGDQPLEFSIVDLTTGAELGNFVAQGTAEGGAQVSHAGHRGGVDEVPIDVPARLHGDDFTVPMPEPTGASLTSELESTGGLRSEAAETEERTGHISPPVRNLAQYRVGTYPSGSTPAPGRVLGDDLTVPFPEPTSAFIDPIEAVDTDKRRAVAPSLLIPRVRSAAPLHVDEQAIPSFHEPERTGTLPEITLGAPELEGETEDLADAADHAAARAFLRASQPGLEARPATGSPLAASPPSLLPLEEHDPETHEVPPPTDEEHPRIQPAEVWVRKKSEWRSAGRLVAGQRVRMLGAWMRLRADGRLVVFSGPRMAGSGTMVDGRHVEIAAGQDAISLPAGASVLLCFKEHGLYVRTEPLADGTDAIAYDAPGAAL